MIVSYKTAEDAANTLELDLNNMDEASVYHAYRGKARLHHPDTGGSLEAFAVVDRAKHVLLHWLRSRPTEAPTEFAKCPICKGTGKRQEHRGFRSMTVQCGACHGSGDAGYDPDRAVE